MVQKAATNGIDETRIDASGPISPSSGLAIDNVVVVLEGATPTVSSSWGAVKAAYR